MSEYQPGYCNIGAAQRRRRYALAAVGAVVAVGYLALVVVRGWPSLLAVGLFAPLAMALEWFLQARWAFCVRFALAGRYDFTGSDGEIGEVRNAVHRQRDRYQAARLTAVALMTAAVLTGIGVGVVMLVG